MGHRYFALKFHPQLQTVAIDTSQINQDGTNSLLIRITGSKLSPSRIKTNQIMNLIWTLTLDEPSDQATMLDVGEYAKPGEAVRANAIMAVCK
jgi:hypothetical protein